MVNAVFLFEHTHFFYKTIFYSSLVTMNMKIRISVLLAVSSFFIGKAQYQFSGLIEDEKWNGHAYLSVIEDYRKLFGVYEDQIINEAAIKNNTFLFTGNNLEATNRIYRIHVDACTDKEQRSNHFNGHCDNSREILFIANNKDTVTFPVSLGNQMFCSVNSNNINSNVFFKIDSLKELMLYDFGNYRSKASRQLNNKKWFHTLQEFGESLNEPLAEIYIYSFLSDRSSDLYEYYRKDLKTNTYYDELLERLLASYPNTSYTNQYKTEITSDKYLSNTTEVTTFSWHYILFVLLGISIWINLFFWYRIKRTKKKEDKELINQLTQQEQKILALIMQDKSNKEIATEMFVSISTVKTHVNNMYKKLGVQSREEAKQLLSK